MNDTKSKLPTIDRDELAAHVMNGAAPDVILTKKTARKVVDVLFDAMGDLIDQSYVIHLQGFGRFWTVETNERIGRNPKTGEEFMIPAGRRIKFKPSKKILG